MSYLIDTNIISEVRKGTGCDARVAGWYESVADDELFLSTLVLGEIRKGVELARPRDSGKAVALERWLWEVEAAFTGRVLIIDEAVSDLWGRMSVEGGLKMCRLTRRSVPAEVAGLRVGAARIAVSCTVTDPCWISPSLGDGPSLDRKGH